MVCLNNIEPDNISILNIYNAVRDIDIVSTPIITYENNSHIKQFSLQSLNSKLSAKLLYDTQEKTLTCFLDIFAGSQQQYLMIKRLEMEIAEAVRNYKEYAMSKEVLDLNPFEITRPTEYTYIGGNTNNV